MRINIEKYKNKSRSDLHSSRLSYSIRAMVNLAIRQPPYTDGVRYLGIC